MILVQTVRKIYSSEAVGCDIFDHFVNFNNCQPEIVSDVLSGTADQDVGMDICANFDDSRLKPSDASFSALFTIVDNFQPEVYCDVISGVIVDPTGVKVRVKFGDSRSNRSRDIQLPHYVTNDDDAGQWRRFA